MEQSKTILNINIYWITLIYIVCSILGFFVNLGIGIAVTSISVVSYISYIVIFNKLKKKVKKENEKIA